MNSIHREAAIVGPETLPFSEEMDSEPDATGALARALIESVISATRDMFEQEEMSSDLPILERLFLEKLEAAMRAGPGADGERTVILASAGPAGAGIKEEAAAEEDEAAPATAAPPVVDRMLHPSGIVPRIDNVMSRADLGCAVNLHLFAERVGNVVYEPRRHSALNIYFRRPKGIAQLYESGKVVCTGCRSEEDSRTCIRKCAALARRIGCSPALREFRVTNIFASCDARFNIRLAHLASAYQIEYNPERSAKLTWRRANPSVVLEISSKGHVMLSGTARTQDLSTAFEQAYPVLVSYRLAQPPPPAVGAGAGAPSPMPAGALANAG
jgi:transcription initiation factor TFIID TATA-box-binding protein